MDSIPVNDLGRALTEQADGLRRVLGVVLASGWLVQGPQHTAFEKELGSYVGVAGVGGVASGTDALELALRALCPQGRRLVVTVANAGGYATVAARRAGLRVRYCDVDPVTHCMDPRDLEKVMDEQVGVVILTHLYGRMGPADEVRSIAQRWGAHLLEDCAQAIGAERNGHRAGSYGDAAAFSFYPTKNLGALGDGGAVASPHPEVVDRVRQLRQYGWDSKYHVGQDGGRNSRLDEIQAAVLRFRLPQVPGWNAERRRIIGQYEAAASDRVRVLPAEDESHSGHLAVAETQDADDLRRHLLSRGVGSDVHYPVPDHRQKAFVARDNPELPVTNTLVGSVLTLPCFPELRDDEVERICDALHTF